MKRILSAAGWFAAGAAAGVTARLFDLQTQILGEVFSRLGAWVLIVTLISLRAPTKARAAFRVFFFCVGMIPGYYIVMYYASNMSYPRYVFAWSVAALCSPAAGWLARTAREEGRLSRPAACAILCAALGSPVLLHGGFRFYDAIIIAILIRLFFFGKTTAPKPSKNEFVPTQKDDKLFL